MIQSGIEVKYREHLFLIEFVLTHLETADRKQVIDSLPFGIRSVRSVRSDRQGQVILARSKILGKKTDTFERRMLGIACNVQLLAVGKVVIGFGQQSAFRLALPGFHGRFEGQRRSERPGELIIEVIGHESVAFGQKYAHLVPDAPGTAQHAVGILKPVLVGQFASFAFHGVGVAGRKAREHRRAEQRHY